MNKYKVIKIGKEYLSEHRYVAEKTYGPIPKGYVVNHKNGIKSDNRPANLEIVTQSENTLHAWSTGLRSDYPARQRINGFYPHCKKCSRSARRNGLCLTCSLPCFVLAILACLLVSSCRRHDSPNPPNPQIFVLIGQSNMVGQAPITQQNQDQNILMLGENGQWQIATHPLHEGQDSIYPAYFDQHGGYGPGIPFAQNLRRMNPNLKIGLVPCARNGIALTEIETTYLQPCSDMITRAKQHGTIAGIIFWQGETDASITDPRADASHWTENATRTIQDIRAITGPVPIVLAVLGDTTDPNLSNMTIIRAQQRALSIPGLTTIETQGLPLQDSVHLDTQGIGMVSQRFAQAICKLTELCGEDHFGF